MHRATPADRLVVHLHRGDDLRIDPRLREDPLRLDAVAAQVAADRFDVDVVEEPREPPLLLIPAEPPRQRPEDRLRGVAVVQHPFVLHILLEQVFRFVSGHLMRLLLSPDGVFPHTLPA